MRRTPVVACALLLAFTLTAAPASAEDAALGLEADALQASGPSAWIGPLAGMVRETQDEPLPGAFQLVAHGLRMETDSRDPVVYANLAFAAADGQTTPANHASATVHGTDSRLDARWILLPVLDRPAPVVEVAASCLEAESPDSSTVEREPRVIPGRGTLVIEAGQAVNLEPCGAATLTVTGDFLLALWEWDIQVQSDQGESRHWSGHGRSQYDPVGSEESRAVVGEDRELFLYATNATLTVQLTAGEAVFLGDASATVDGSLLLRGARGALPVAGPEYVVSGQDVLFSGHLDAALHAAGDGLGVGITGAVQGVAVNGQAVPLPGPGPDAWPWLLAAAVLVAAMGVAWWYAVYPLRVHAGASRAASAPWKTPAASWRERRSLGWCVKAKGAVARRSYAWAGWYAGLAVRAARGRVEARWLRAVVYHRRGRYEDQLAEHRALDALVPRGKDRAHNALMAARACRRLGRLGDEASWEAVAHREAPGLRLGASTGYA